MGVGGGEDDVRFRVVETIANQDPVSELRGRVPAKRWDRVLIS